MSSSNFCTVVNCMDGRTQIQVNDYLKRKYDVEYVDTITERGPVRILAEGLNGEGVDSILQRVDVSVHKHGSRGIAVVAHHDCAGNPVDGKLQRDQAIKSAELLRGQYDGVDVIAIWVNEDWAVEEL